MQAKPTASTHSEKSARAKRSPSAGPVARMSDDLERAEGEGMGLASSPMSADAERHLARYGGLSRRVMAFDLASESGQLSMAPEATHTARTLAKLDTIRLTVMKIKAGETVQEHQVAHQVSLHTLSGHVVLHIEGDPVDMPAGHVTVLGRGVAHDIAATEDSTVLITVSAPEAARSK